VTPSTSEEVTRLLGALRGGDRDALGRLLPLVYDELHLLAQRAMRHERGGHTLQATALVNEAYLRLVDQRRAGWEHRTQFLAVAAQLMRRILVDHARGRGAAKRGGGQERVPLENAAVSAPEKGLDLVSLDEALTRLARIDAQQARVVELRFFGGLTVEEAAEVLGVSPATVKREWTMAKAWLRRELSGA
jgi:RNA polymerase sigma factor (TIGR02999 family)